MFRCVTIQKVGAYKMTSECTTETEARLFLPGAVLHYERRTDVLDRLDLGHRCGVRSEGRHRAEITELLFPWCIQTSFYKRQLFGLLRIGTSKQTTRILI